MSSFPGWGGDPWGRLHAWFTPVLHSRILFVERKDGREEKITNHTPSQKLKSQTTGKSFSDPEFQMGLSPDSFKFFPACLHLNFPKLPPKDWFAVLCSLTPWATTRLLIPNQPQVSVDSPSQLHWTDLFFRVSCNAFLLSSLLFVAHLQYFPSLSAFSLNIRASLSFWSGLQKCFPSLGNLIHPHRLSYLLSEEYACSMLSIPGLSLKEQTLTSNETTGHLQSLR